MKTFPRGLFCYARVCLVTVLLVAGCGGGGLPFNTTLPIVVTFVPRNSNVDPSPLKPTTGKAVYYGRTDHVLLVASAADSLVPPSRGFSLSIPKARSLPFRRGDVVHLTDQMDAEFIGKGNFFYFESEANNMAKVWIATSGIVQILDVDEGHVTLRFLDVVMRPDLPDPPVGEVSQGSPILKGSGTFVVSGF